MKRFAILCALFAASCATPRVDTGTPSSPATMWVPSAATAVPPRAAETNVPTLNGVTPGSNLSLAQVIDIALSNNPQTRTTWLQARAAEAALGSSESAYLPEIDVSATAGRVAHLVATRRRTSFEPSVALNYLLFDFGGREAQVEQARQTLIAADYLHNQAIQDVILRAEQTYYSYLDAKALLAAQEATLKERRTSLDAADARHNAGVATIADVLQARTAMSQAELNRESIEGQLRTIEGLLATVMGLPATTHFDFGELPLDVPGAARHDAGRRADHARGGQSSRPHGLARHGRKAHARAFRKCGPQGLPSISINSSAGRTFFSGGGNYHAVLRGRRRPLPALHRLPQHVRHPPGADRSRSGEGRCPLARTADRTAGLDELLRAADRHAAADHLRATCSTARSNRPTSRATATSRASAVFSTCSRPSRRSKARGPRKFRLAPIGFSPWRNSHTTPELSVRKAK